MPITGRHWVVTWWQAKYWYDCCFWCHTLKSVVRVWHQTDQWYYGGQWWKCVLRCLIVCDTDSCQWTGCWVFASDKRFILFIMTAISVENRKKNFRPLVFCAPTVGVLLGIGYQCWWTKIEWWVYRPWKKFYIFSRVNRIHEQTDGQTPGDCKDVASRGKK